MRTLRMNKPGQDQKTIEKTSGFGMGLLRWGIRKQAWLVPVLLFFLAMVYYRLQGGLVYHFDAESYYKLSNSFLANGSFSFRNFPADYRGYFFPFLLFLMQLPLAMVGIVHENAIAFGGSLVAVITLSVITPKLLGAGNRPRDLVLRILPFCLLLVWWSDTIFYPITDFWAIALFLTALLCLQQIQKSSGGFSVRTGLLAFLAGVLLYGAYNTRTIYLFVVPVVILIFILANRNSGWKAVFLWTAVLTIGFFICGLPQVLINRMYFDSSSILVNTELKIGPGTSLFSAQLRGGIFLERYETYVGNELDGIGGLYFIDKAGLAIRDAAGLAHRELTGIGEYISLVLRYPLDFIGIYARHLINALYLPFHEIYITELYNHNLFYALANYAVWFLSLACILWKLSDASYRRSLWKDSRTFYLVCLLIPCICILPGAIETRFFLPGYVLLYLLLAKLAVNPQFWSDLKAHWLRNALLFLSILAVCCCVWGSAFASVEGLPLFLSR